ncbi:MAG: thioredoxin domain-containing protein [Sulfurovum sp.]|nr:MAG: thioredoxin domain-containing protein [Sulfurovum sp.]
MVFCFLSILLFAEQNYTNALITENSPYLQQHAHNPVDWYPWGEEAFAKAKKENKLIFLSIGYSTCHWCHVMEEESFVDEMVAQLLNDHFVSIKVDKEEYSHIDKKYQKRYREVYGKRGGWPLSVFLSPHKEIFHMATYIPKEEGYGSKGLLPLLSYFIKLKEKPKDFSQAILKYKNKKHVQGLKQTIHTKIIDKVLDDIEKQFDTQHGGFAKHPKFPEASKVDLLLDIYKLKHNQKAFTMAAYTLRKMAKGGIYDQIGGGFFRYTTDDAWQIPHFEKMLYTNAALIAVYVKLYEMTGDRLYQKVVEESIAQMEKHYMQQGVYLSASDADSDGEEGGYFIYEYTEVKNALKTKGWKPKEIEDVLSYMGIEENGNIDGDFSQPHITSAYAPKRLKAFKDYLRFLRTKRTFPFVDNKVNTAWNAMMIKALFVASRIKKEYLPLAEKRLNHLLAMMYQKNTLYHQTLRGKRATQKALLEDYAFLIDALIEGYGRNHNSYYIHLANKLSTQTIQHFYIKKYWYLSDDNSKVVADFDDKYYTSALSTMLENLVRLDTLNERLKYHTIVKETLLSMGGVLDENLALVPKLVEVVLRLNYGDIIVHAPQKKLNKVQSALDKVNYPFLLSATKKSDRYLACKTTMCFAEDKNITKLIEKINEVVK